MNKDSNKKFAFTLAEGATHVGIFHNTRRVAFTLAEVLITLGIIGIVSALTIPTLVKEYQKKVTVTKLQKVHAILNQIARMSLTNDAIKSYTTGQEVTEEKTKQFFDEFIFPYLKSPKIIDKGSTIYKNCQENSDYCYKEINQNNYYKTAINSNYKIGRLFFATNENIFYCINIMENEYIYDDNENVTNTIRKYRNIPIIIVDINGTSTPNTLGKDIFMFEMDLVKGNAYPRFINNTDENIELSCNKNATGATCAEKIRRDGWKISDDYPW